LDGAVLGEEIGRHRGERGWQKWAGAESITRGKQGSEWKWSWK
jgi:hypothetical protein